MYTRPVDVSAFEYRLPPAAIAQTPAEQRDASRLLVIDRPRQRFCDRRFADLPALLRPGDCLVVNDSRVIPARVLARAVGSERPVEIVFLEEATGGRWLALVRPGRRCLPGATLVAGDDEQARLRVVGIDADGARLLERFDGTIPELLARHGLPPLPPYITRFAKPAGEDWERYQTVYACHPGSAAAPTAGLHFTPEILARLKARGVEVHALTLHIGPATFRPLPSGPVEQHVIPGEQIVLTAEVAHAVNVARAEGRRVVAVGTTTTRALEGAARGSEGVEPLAGRVELFIRPGHVFRVVDALITNFHLPRSSLLVLVSAFAGRELILSAYAHAVRAGYRFYSYGDATLIQ
ncbi:MAG: tRNA preQ1(34) S-adenosylmethionine ribosyltransferase-isomerase QueA [Candidatus Rokuibacteriota bacterium]